MDATEPPVRSFSITTKRMEFEPEISNDQGRVRRAEGRYLVTFMVQNTGSYPDRPFEIPVWVFAHSVRSDDVIRAAKHQLHQELQLLLAAATSFRISDEDLPTVFQTK